MAKKGPKKGPKKAKKNAENAKKSKHKISTKGATTLAEQRTTTRATKPDTIIARDARSAARTRAACVDPLPRPRPTAPTSHRPNEEESPNARCCGARTQRERGKRRKKKIIWGTIEK